MRLGRHTGNFAPIAGAFEDLPIIQSRQNQQIKQLRKLQDKKHRERSGLFVGEGEDILAEALRFGRPPQELYLAAGVELEIAADLPEPVLVDPEVLNWVSALGSGSRVLGVWKQFRGEIGGAGVVVYLEGVGDPGNVGTIIRALHAFSEGVVALGPGCADPFSPKAVRASMGSIFARPPVLTDFDRIAELSLPKIALTPRSGRPLGEVELNGPVVLCLGAERDGVGDSVLERCDEITHIATLDLDRGGADSLNVAMAAALALYEVAQRRLSKEHG